MSLEISQRVIWFLSIKRHGVTSLKTVRFWYVTIYSYFIFSCSLTLCITLRLMHFGYIHEKC